MDHKFMDSAENINGIAGHIYEVVSVVCGLVMLYSLHIYFYDIGLYAFLNLINMKVHFFNL